MALTLILLCAAALLVISALSLILHSSALGCMGVYGGSLTVSAVGFGAGLAQLLGQGFGESLTLPLGCPGSARISASMRSPLSFSWLSISAPPPQACMRSASASTNIPRNACCPSIRCFSPA
jgi:hypothetical protein